MSVAIRRYKDGKAWEVDIRVRTPDGSELRERRKAPMVSKTAARRWAEKRAAHLALHGPTPPARSVPTLSAFFPRFLREHCVANGHKPSGIESKESVFRMYLAPHLGHRRLDAITLADVAQLKSQLSSKAPSTTNNVLTVLNMILRCAADWGVVDEVPAHATLLKVSNATPRFYSDNEYERLVDAARQWPRAHLMVLLGGDAGLRRGEMLGLRWEDCQLASGVLQIRRSVWKGEETATKGAEERVVPMTGRLKAELEEASTDDGSTVLASNGTAPTRRSLRNWLQRAQAVAGLVPKGGVHVLRHTFLTRLAVRGAAPHTMQRLAGHRDFKTTLRYLWIADEEARRAIGLLEGDGEHGRRGQRGAPGMQTQTFAL